MVKAQNVKGIGKGTSQPYAAAHPYAPGKKNAVEGAPAPYPARQAITPKKWLGADSYLPPHGIHKGETKDEGFPRRKKAAASTRGTSNGYMVRGKSLASIKPIKAPTPPINDERADMQ